MASFKEVPLSDDQGPVTFVTVCIRQGGMLVDVCHQQALVSGMPVPEVGDIVTMADGTKGEVTSVTTAASADTMLKKV